MDVQIQDYNALSRISPPLLTSYLETLGWTREENWRGRISVWSKMSDERRRQILVPLMESSDTYGVRISEAVTTLAEVERRSQLNVYYEAISAGADVIRLSPANGGAASGRSISESADLLRNAREIVRSAARSADRPGQPVYRGRASSTVSEYMNGVHPIPGYETGGDLILHSRVPPSYGEQTDMGDTFREPFARNVTLALHRGISEADSIVREVHGGAELSLFENAAQRGVNANMCEAVSSLAKGQRGVGISLSWAAVRPPSAPERGVVEFSESDADILADGAKLLRRNNPFIDARVTGEIVRLDRKSEEEFDGRAVVLYQMDRRPIALQVQFAPPDHNEVVRAFREGVEISVDGDIHLEGRRYTLRNPRNFMTSRQER